MTFDPARAMEEDTPTEPPKDAIKRAVEMGHVMEAAEAEVTRLTDELKAAKNFYNDIAMDKLPSLLKELGLEGITLDTGEKIDIKGDVAASITKAKHEAAMQWLIDNQFGGIIKTLVTVSFPSEEQEDAAEFAQEVMAEHDGVVFKAAVHPATLKSFVKERLAAGDSLPLDLFSVHEYSIAKLTRPRSN